MPRPIKQGLDYFPLVTDFFSNKKIKSIRRAHDTIGILTYLNLLSRVYREEGYFYRFDDLEELSMDIAEEIANKQLRSVAASVAETINYLVGRGTLDQGLFEKGVISGVALQKQYVISAYKSKRKIKMDVHLLVDVDEVIAEFKKNSEETAFNSEETAFNSEESTQSKSKVNKNVKEREINNFLTTTTTAGAPARKDYKGDPPTLTQAYAHFKDELGVDNAHQEADAFIAYNAMRGWSCLPNWKAAADLWAARIPTRGNGSRI